jgi:peptide/nickel transport system substrate-binding protein
MHSSITLTIGVVLLASHLAYAATLRVANVGDVNSLDPHAQSESLHSSFTGNMYEPLVGRDKNMKIEPLLATDWARSSATLWRFNLRRGVRFHDGRLFSADDVVFSLERAAADTSARKFSTASFKQVRKIDEHTIEIETLAPLVILPEMISNIPIMSKSWCEQHKVLAPADRRSGVRSAADFIANGTGPFKLKERQPDFRTVLVRNTTYWGTIDGNLDEVIFTPIVNDASRVAALVSGQVDVMEPAPLSDRERIRSTGRFDVLEGPELRTIYLGMDQSRDELLFSNVRGRNPFRDKRVRQAMYQAIDAEAIRRNVMRNASISTALMVAPGVRGFQADMNTRPAYDPVAAKRLLVEAGYPEGFEVVMHCTNDRYVNDNEICQAIAAQLARVGILVRVTTESKSRFFPRMGRRETSFYMMGWTPYTVDAHNVLSAVMATPNGAEQGNVNFGSYSNSRVDELTRLIGYETDEAKRDAMIREAFKIHQDDIGHIPLHQQALAWGVSRRVRLVQLPNSHMPFKWVSISPD